MFSTYSAHRVFWRGEFWATAEHAYQAAKFDPEDPRGLEVIVAIKDASSPDRAKELARNHEHIKRPDWPRIKLPVTREITKAKLLQHLDVREGLLETGTRQIVENSPDSFWGWGRNTRGLNHRGKIWMELRLELQSEKPESKKFKHVSL